MDSLYIIKKQLEECRDKLADYETGFCANCKFYTQKGMFGLSGLGYCSNGVGREYTTNNVTEEYFGCKLFERKTDENNK